MFRNFSFFGDKEVSEREREREKRNGVDYIAAKLFLGVFGDFCVRGIIFRDHINEATRSGMPR